MSITGIGEIATAVGGIVDKFLPDKTQAEKDELTRELAQLQFQQAVIQSQTDTNKAEASNQSVFVAGWRPAVGWVCAGAFAWTFILAPFISYAAKLAGNPVDLPNLDLSQLSPVLMGMLGLGAMRTVEKVNGIKAGH
ncbi:MAG: holin family protein [Elusimicrobia bacterium]|nr:holin family protein [Elusimicrobiota bacterium]